MRKPEPKKWFETVWTRVCADLREAIGEQRYNFWIAPLRIASANHERIVLVCVTPTERDGCVAQFGSQIADLVQQHAKRMIPIDFVAESKPQLVAVAQANGGASDRGWDLVPPLTADSITFNAESTFGALVVLPSNPLYDGPREGHIRRITCEDVKRHTAAFYGVSVADIDSKNRQRSVVLPRQVAMHVCKTVLQRSYPQIGAKFFKDHTSVLHSVHKIAHMIETNQSFALEVEALKQLIHAWSLQAGQPTTVQ